MRQKGRQAKELTRTHPGRRSSARHSTPPADPSSLGSTSCPGAANKGSRSGNTCPPATPCGPNVQK